MLQAIFAASTRWKMLICGRSDHGDVDIDDLVKNPACMACMQTP